MSSLRLEFLSGPDRGATHVLSGISILGRDDACGVRVRDPSVSREHAVIRPDEGGFVVEDLDSRLGTFVNGTRTRKAVLLDGDVITIGPIELRVRSNDALDGEVPPEEVEVVRSRFQPTARLSLDVVKFRTSAHYLQDSGGALPALGSAAPSPAREGAADAPAPDAPTPRRRPAPVTRRLELLCEVGNSLAAVHQPGQLARETAARLVGMFPGLRRIGFFELVDADDEGDPVLRPTYVIDRSERAPGKSVQISRAVLQQAIETRQAVLSEDVHIDPRFAQSDSVQTSGVRSMICAPLCVGERVRGALYVDSTDRRLDEGALRLVTGIAAIVASAFENARLFAKVQTESVRRASLERYFSPDLVDRVLRGDLPLAREGHLTHGTILFVDIRGFTRLTAITDPSLLVATLNAYFAGMQRIIFRSRGTVERFGGDSILAYWGVVDEDPDGPLRATRAALSMQAEVFRLNPELQALGRPPIQVAVGLNTGDVIAGDVGSAERYEFTVLGDAINMARRFEALAGPWEVVAGAATVAALEGRLLHRHLPPTRVKGKDEPVVVSLVHGLRVDAPDPSVRKFELALPGQLTVDGASSAALARDLSVTPNGARLELLTVADPPPGTAVELALTLPRSDARWTGRGEVLPEPVAETRVLGAALTSLGGVGAVAVAIADPSALLGWIGVPGSG